jgi:type I restriction enzyme R subunit
MPAGTQKPDVQQRLQALVAGWRGAERGQPITALHEECRQAAGGLAISVLPAHLVLVSELDVSNLDHALRRHGISTELAFRIPPVGRFDAALVPVGRRDETPDRWLLALNDGLPAAEQIALYAHAVGHLLLSHSSRLMGAGAELDPGDGRAHADTLARLQQQEHMRALLDRQVLETYPILAALLRPPQDATSSAVEGQPSLGQILADAGWRAPLVQRSYSFTDGRVLGTTGKRGSKERVDALLRAEASLPIAVARVRRKDESLVIAETALRNLACDRFYVPFAYLLDGTTIHEYDWTPQANGLHTIIEALPNREALLTRWLHSAGLTDPKAREALCFPYQLSGNKPRYYQEAAINRAVIAVLQAQRGVRAPRVLLTQATGTGKTKVAFQITWKLRQTHVVNNVLFLTDRDTLLGQAKDNDFVPFGDARGRVRGQFITSRSIFFATYQALDSELDGKEMFRHYAHDYFSLIIVDECHRGSAQDDSNWRKILDWFDQAIQIGLTATPLRSDNVHTYEYFGDPIATYSLRQGILDGFLAPYKVRRVLMAAEHGLEQPALPATIPTKQTEEVPQSTSAPPPAMLVEEARSVLIDRTTAIAEHLAAYLRETDPMAKTIVFCVDQAHAEAMKAALQTACAEQVSRHPDYVERIVADEGQDGKRALGRFQQPAKHTPVIVTTSKLLSTGIDVPTCKNIVLARPVDSIVEFKQIIGRGTRLHLPTKTSFTIVDYAGATKYFFDPEFDGHPETVTVDTLMPTPTESPASDPPPVLPGSSTVSPFPQLAGTVEIVTTPAKSEVVAADGTDPAQSQGYSHHELPVPALREPASPLPYETNGADSATTTTNEVDEPPVVEVTVRTPGTETMPALQPAATRSGSAANATSVGQRDVPLVITGPEYVRPADGRRIRVVGEIVLELGPDGNTLRAVSYQEYTLEALAGLCTTPAELRACWLRPEQRQEIRDRLEEQGLNLHELAAVRQMPDADPFDLLLHVAFGQQPLTRRERADRLQREHADFLARYQGLAREVLNTVLAKYAVGEAPDISDVDLLLVPPLSGRGTVMELAQSFPPPDGVQTALRELQELLYTA